jgi:hypothetical protein
MSGHCVWTEFLKIQPYGGLLQILSLLLSNHISFVAYLPDGKYVSIGIWGKTA